MSFLQNWAWSPIRCMTAVVTWGAQLCRIFNAPSFLKLLKNLWRSRRPTAFEKKLKMSVWIWHEIQKWRNQSQQPRSFQESAAGLLWKIILANLDCHDERDVLIAWNSELKILQKLGTMNLENYFAVQFAKKSIIVPKSVQKNITLTTRGNAMISLSETNSLLFVIVEEILV